LNYNQRQLKERSACSAEQGPPQKESSTGQQLDILSRNSSYCCSAS